jgi:hypothetical protein
MLTLNMVFQPVSIHLAIFFTLALLPACVSSFLTFVRM